MHLRANLRARGRFGGLRRVKKFLIAPSIVVNPLQAWIITAPMDLLLVCFVACAGAALTLYSGFGLGTVLLPAMVLVFPPDQAVAATAVVHLLTNLFKGGLVYRAADLRVTARFGLPAVLGAVAGGLALGALGRVGPVFPGAAHSPTWMGLVIGLLLIGFAIAELTPWFQRLAVPARFAPLGGLATGFFGGLSGQQGALRSAFLMKTGLSPQAFIATGVLIAIVIDLARLPTYALSMAKAGAFATTEQLGSLAAATLSAFVGAWAGMAFFKKTTIGAVRIVVSAMMIAIGLALATGMIGGASA